MKIYTVLARLLDYPTQELLDHLAEIIDLVSADESVSPNEHAAIHEVIGWMQLHDLTGLQQDYVQTFDMVPEHDLHITHHIHGDSRDRGPALIDLTEHFKANGLEVEKGEIPDYLPLLLEYVSTLGETESRFFLADMGKVLDVLAGNLERSATPYAKLVRLIEQRGRLLKAA
jgi:nitrate reductase delta subunit